MTKIADYAYMRNFSLEEALIPQNVTEIGNNAFFMCTNLKTLKMQKFFRKQGEKVVHFSGFLPAAAYSPKIPFIYFAI